MVYWERLADIINREPVYERDRFFLAMLKPLGIVKGKPFQPTARQARILTEATLLGEAMARRPARARSTWEPTRTKMVTGFNRTLTSMVIPKYHYIKHYFPLFGER